MNKRQCEGVWEYNLDVEILVLGSIHYYHHGVCIFKADDTSRLQQQVTPGRASSPPCGERSAVQGGRAPAEYSIGPLAYLTDRRQRAREE